MHNAYHSLEETICKYMKLQQQTNSVLKKINIPQRINQINDIDSVIGTQRWEKVLEEVVVMENFIG